MNEERLFGRIDILEAQLGRMATSLEQIAQAMMPAEPNYRQPFEAYATFDWSSINAQVISADEYGATTVRWGGHANWTRRYAPGTSTRKPSLWFSRAAAAEDSDGAQWFTLITFRDLAPAEPLPRGSVPKKTAPKAPKPSAKAAQTNGNGNGNGKPNGVQIDKDWRKEAIDATEPLMFDTAVQRWLANYFTAVSTVTKARETICGPWDKTKTQAAADALHKYVEKVTNSGKPLTEAKQTALTESRRVYNMTGPTS